MRSVNHFSMKPAFNIGIKNVINAVANSGQTPAPDAIDSPRFRNSGFQIENNP
jgi:hypothetical protein